MADGFHAALLALSGSRASVQTAAEFFAVPGAAPQCTAALCTHASEPSGPCFVERLRALYVANEALGLGASASGVAPALLAGLPTLLGLAASVAPDDEALAKLSALVRLWESRRMVPADAVATLLRSCERVGDRAAQVPEPPVPAGALPALVRRAGAGYIPLPRSDVGAAARRSSETLPAPAAQPYYDLRLAKFDEETAQSRKHSRAATAEAAGFGTGAIAFK